MHIWWFLKFVMFFVWKAYQTLLSCQNCPCDQPAKPGKYFHQQPHKFYKTVTCIHHCPLWHEHRHWGIDIPDIIYLWIFDPFLNNPTTFLGFCSTGDYRYL